MTGCNTGIIAAGGERFRERVCDPLQQDWIIVMSIYIVSHFDRRAEYQRRSASDVLAVLAVLLLSAAAAAPVEAPVSPTPAVLIVAGGPLKRLNQVAIESNARYVMGLFPTNAITDVLFADGKKDSEDVLYEAPAAKLEPGEAALNLLMSPQWRTPMERHYRATRLSRLDGPASRDALGGAFDQLSKTTHRPIVLYFAGHGSQGRHGNVSENAYNLWHDTITPPELAPLIARLPTDTPITLVMAQCFAGAFGDEIFQNGRPTDPVAPQDIAGFFGTTADRVAAGCTPDVHEADYQDFTSYFMAALSGRDRLGKPVSGADYNHDGQVGMDEAFCYALVNDPTIDVPVCTSDVFLRARVTSQDSEVFHTPAADVREWATAAQNAAIDALSHEAAPMHSGPLTDFHTLYEQFLTGAKDPERSPALQSAFQRAGSHFEKLRSNLRESILKQWPELADRNPPAAARTAAMHELAGDRHAADLVDADAALERDAAQWEDADAAAARRLRLLRLVKTVVLTHRVLNGKSAVARQYLERLLRAERRPLFTSSVAPA